MKYHLTPTGVTIKKKKKAREDVAKDVEKQNPYTLLMGM